LIVGFLSLKLSHLRKSQDVNFSINVDIHLIFESQEKCDISIIFDLE